MNHKLLPFVFALIISVRLFAQAPQEMNYQTVVRDANGKPLANTTVGVKYVIHNNTEQGPEVFQQTGTAQTNQFGLITFKIGSNSNLAVVDWSNGAKYLQVLVDVSGGTNYVDMGTSQLVSVPYALFAANSQTGPPGATGATGPTGPSGGGGGATDAWVLTGNAGTTPASNFIGTTDNQPLLVKTGGSAAANERMRFTATPQIVVNGTVARKDALMTIYGSGVTNALNNTLGTTGLPIMAYSSDTFAGVYGINTGLGQGLIGENTGPALNNGGSGIYGGSINGWGIFGTTQSNIAPAYPAILGYGQGNVGTGTAGLGNGLNTYYTYNGGSGGAFTGRELGLYGYAYGGGNLFSAGGYFQDSVGLFQTTYAAVGAYILGTKYKIYGDGTVSTVVPDNNNSRVIMYAPEAPEVLFQDYGEGKLVNGKAVITLDPVFSKNIIVNEKHPLRVIIQPKGECEGLYVSNDNQFGFEVHEMKGGQSNIRFTYQVVANRADEVIGGTVASKYADLRFPQYVQPAAPQAHTISGVRGIK